jgi:hypothetical protein
MFTFQLAIHSPKPTIVFQLRVFSWGVVESIYRVPDSVEQKRIPRWGLVSLHKSRILLDEIARYRVLHSLYSVTSDNAVDQRAPTSVFAIWAILAVLAISMAKNSVRMLVCSCKPSNACLRFSRLHSALAFPPFFVRLGFAFDSLRSIH